MLYNTCLIMGKLCQSANVFGDCTTDKKDCDNETPFILNDNYSTEKKE